MTAGAATPDNAVHCMQELVCEASTAIGASILSELTHSSIMNKVAIISATSNNYQLRSKAALQMLGLNCKKHANDCTKYLGLLHLLIDLPSIILGDHMKIHLWYFS